MHCACLKLLGNAFFSTGRYGHFSNQYITHSEQIANVYILFARSLSEKTMFMQLIVVINSDNHVLSFSRRFWLISPKLHWFLHIPLHTFSTYDPTSGTNIFPHVWLKKVERWMAWGRGPLMLLAFYSFKFVWSPLRIFIGRKKTQDTCRLGDWSLNQNHPQTTGDLASLCLVILVSFIRVLCMP